MAFIRTGVVSYPWIERLMLPCLDSRMLVTRHEATIRFINFNGELYEIRYA